MTGETFEEELRGYGNFYWVPAALESLGHSMDQDGGHDYGHLLRVLRNAHQITLKEQIRGENIDWEVVVASVVLHDVVNLPKNDPKRHEASKRSAELASSILKPWFNSNRIVLIAEAIETHSFSSGLIPGSIEARVVTDADRLESLGAFGIARTFYVSGLMGGKIVSMSDPFGTTRPLDDRMYAVDHFFAKLLHLRERMVTPSGRDMADQRHRFLESFLDQLKNELGC